MEDTKKEISKAELLDSYIKAQEIQGKARKELIEKLTSYTLCDELKNNSSSLKRKEKKELAKKEVKVPDYDENGKEKGTKKVKITLENADIYQEVKEELIDALAEMRGINLDELEESDISVWIDTIIYRTIAPLEFEGK